ncbi:hypothetical protein C9F11_42960 (plasmid) [Streptomyces sp. YIM 121038]|uniref:hypothetical protein n=1 Tax=Streptomyces sp. YIM 121038 TaxID=2136401 RepID=UPI0011106825|nr:hypothetical protein [Streptomyces sp. YIM 121038]QCX82172.1 hypothetical protein C9F11_42960 [Streptomyces sp. YIM 121038]
MTATSSTGSAPAGSLADEDETRVASARITATRLGTALVRDPLDRTVHEQMRHFLDHDSEPALRSWAALKARTPEELKSRIAELLMAQAERSVS